MASEPTPVPSELPVASADLDAAATRERDPFRRDLTASLKPLWRYLSSRVRYAEEGRGVWADDNRANEILANVVLEALSRRDEKPAGGGMYRWLRGIADQALARELAAAGGEPVASLDELQERNPQEREALQLPQDAAPEQPMLSDASDIDQLSPEERTVRDEFQHAIVSALRDLPDDLREPFLLHTRDGRSFEEIASLEGIDAAEVATLVGEARQLLRDRMAEEYDGLDDDALPAIDTMYEALEDVPLDDAWLDALAGRLDAGNAGAARD